MSINYVSALYVKNYLFLLWDVWGPWWTKKLKYSISSSAHYQVPNVFENWMEKRKRFFAIISFQKQYSANILLFYHAKISKIWKSISADELLFNQQTITNHDLRFKYSDKLILSISHNKFSFMNSRKYGEIFMQYKSIFVFHTTRCSKSRNRSDVEYWVANKLGKILYCVEQKILKYYCKFHNTTKLLFVI